MKLFNYKPSVVFSNAKDEHYRIGLHLDGKNIDLQEAAKKIDLEITSEMKSYFEQLSKNDELARKVLEKFTSGDFEELIFEISDKHFAPAVPKPLSCRDAYAFRQHVETSRQNRNVEMIPEFDQFPVFYFTNHLAIKGSGEIFLEKDHFESLDFELEIAAVIGKHGKNISASEADEYIYGFTVMNDLSARRLQMEEMKLNLGPAKGKDFATAIGPFLVTKDELENYKSDPPVGHTGAVYNLPMKAYHNNKLISSGNFKDISWTFAEIIERVSYGVEIFPSEVIGSGTVGTGCLYELNGTAKRENPDYNPVWLQENDEIRLEIDHLGSLKNVLRKNTEYSIFDLKKNL